jgi:hypothetical protein
MRQRQRRREEDQETTRPPAGGADGAGLQALRHEGEDFLSAADAAIDKALSRDSARFNAATRQQGGQ